MPTTVNFNAPGSSRIAKARRLIRLSDGDMTVDGDTMAIEQPIRMVSCDTPEKGHYAGNPPVSQQKLEKCLERLGNGFYGALPEGLRDYLGGKLTNDAAQRHIGAGIRATEAFGVLLAERLTLPDGNTRRLATIPTGEIVDDYGRMLAYLAPWFTGSQSDPLPPPDDPRRRTLNLDMIENGWAAFFPIYGSLPKKADMNRAIAAAEVAWEEQRGAWQEFGETLLLGYEYRMCIKLAEPSKDEQGNIVPDQNPEVQIGKAFQRSCVDMRNMQEVGRVGFHAVPPWARLWFWWDDRRKARDALGLPAVND